jgi:hypothetical protein
VIATRRYQTDDGAPLEVGVDAPVQVSSEEWQCGFRVGERVEYASGVDALQALQLAINGIRYRLNELPPIRWESGTEMGDIGLEPLVPHGFGLAWSRHIGQVIERELVAFVAQHRGRRCKPEP